MLYQYKQFNKNTIALLLLNDLWFSKPEKFNDPYDCHVNFTYHGSIEEWVSFVNKHESVIPQKDHIIEQVKKNKDIFEETINNNNIITMNNKLRVACFSESPSNFLLWSHYADYHQGLCICYNTYENETNNKMKYIEIQDDTIELLRSKNKQYLPIQKVQYSSKSAYSFNQIEKDDIDLEKYILTKNSIWKYEKEWRTYTSDINKESVHLADTSIKSLIMGSKFSSNDEKVLRKIIQIINASRIQKIGLFKMQIDQKINKLIKSKCIQ